MALRRYPAGFLPTSRELVSTSQWNSASDSLKDYVSVDWGEDFHAVYGERSLETGMAVVSVGLGALGMQYILQNGGSGYFPLRVARPYLEDGRLHLLEGAPRGRRPAYVVYPQDPTDPEVVQLALEGLRHVVSLEREG